ncbi:penicillin-binding protein 2 [bacterium]|nr:penicillin-binding protein 2 [bacterium]
MVYSTYEKMPITLPPRVVIALSCIIAAFFLLAARLWYLQAIRGESFAERSKNNRQKTVFVPPARGVIRDRHGVPLAKNRPAFNVEMYLHETPDVDQTIDTIAELLGEPAQEYRERLQKQGGPRFRPRILLRDASRTEVERILAHRWYLPGVFINHYPIRWYEHGHLASHVLGHIREIGKSDLDKPEFKGYYQPGDLIGKSGLELQWELYLQGRRGLNRFVVNAHSVKIRDLPEQVPAIPGNILELTLDKDVQAAADTALQGEWGAVVAMVPKTGEILALSSAPNFDPNIFTGELSPDQWSEMINGREKILNNRAVQEVYPPGSVFKAFLGAAGLEEGLITPSTTEYCPGYHKVGNATFRCHKRSGHGNVNLEQALTVSCDVYFYVLGARLGIDRIHEYATRFGFGTPTGLDLVHEAPGLIPSKAWKKRRFAGTEESRWYPGETPSVAIGQGATSVTPMQLAVALSALVNGGKVMRPYLVKAMYSSDGQIVTERGEPKIVGEVGIREQYLQRVQEDLIEVVHGARGTARRARLPEEWEIKAAGKTGTSQVVALSAKTDKREHEHHALYAGYAPAKDPEILVAAIVEHGGSGGLAAAPVARQVMEAYFRKFHGKVHPDAPVPLVSEGNQQEGDGVEGGGPP